MKRPLLAILAVLATALPAGAATRVAVLPFEAPTDTTVMAALGPGTMDSLITALMRLPELVVIDRATIQQVLQQQTFQRSGLVEGTTAVRMGHILGAQALMTGRVQVIGNRVRITASFIDGETGAVRHAEQVTGPIDSVFDLQDELASRFITAQGIHLSPGQDQRLAADLKATRSLEAYDLYQRGRTAYLQFTPAGYERAASLYRLAITKDPAYANAHAGLAEALAMWGFRREQFGQSCQDLYREAVTAARQALAADGQSPLALRAMAVTLRSLKDPAAATYARRALAAAPNDAEAHVVLWMTGERDPQGQELQQALALNPNLLVAHEAVGNALQARGRFPEAITCYRRAIERIPNAPELHHNLGLALFRSGQLDEARQAFDAALRLDPGSVDALAARASVLAAQGHLPEAIEGHQAALRLNPEYTFARFSLGRALLDLGRLDDAAAAFREVLRLHPDDVFAHSNLGTTLVRQARPTEAIVHFETVLRLKPGDAFAERALQAARTAAGQAR